jgi:hypothetical protein
VLDATNQVTAIPSAPSSRKHLLVNQTDSYCQHHKRVPETLNNVNSTYVVVVGNGQIACHYLLSILTLTASFNNRDIRLHALDIQAKDVFETRNTATQVSYFNADYKNEYDVEHTLTNRVTIGHDWQVMSADHERLNEYLSEHSYEKILKNANGKQSSTYSTAPLNGDSCTPYDSVSSTTIDDDAKHSQRTTATGTTDPTDACTNGLICDVKEGSRPQRPDYATHTCSVSVNGVMSDIKYNFEHGDWGLKVLLIVLSAIVTYLVMPLFDVVQPGHTKQEYIDPDYTIVDVPVAVRAYVLPHNGMNDVPCVLKALQIVQQSGWTTGSAMTVNNRALAVAQEHTKTHVKIGLKGKSAAVLPSLLQNRTITRLSIDARGRYDEQAIYRILLENMVYLTKVESIDIVFYHKIDAAMNILRAVYAHCLQVHTVKLQYLYGLCYTIDDAVPCPASLRSLELVNVKCLTQ